MIRILGNSKILRIMLITHSIIFVAAFAIWMIFLTDERPPYLSPEEYTTPSIFLILKYIYMAPNIIYMAPLAQFAMKFIDIPSITQNQLVEILLDVWMIIVGFAMYSYVGIGISSFYNKIFQKRT